MPERADGSDGNPQIGQRGRPAADHAAAMRKGLAQVWQRRRLRLSCWCGGDGHAFLGRGWACAGPSPPRRSSRVAGLVFGGVMLAARSLERLAGGVGSRSGGVICGCLGACKCFAGGSGGALCFLLPFVHAGLCSFFRAVQRLRWPARPAAAARPPARSLRALRCVQASPARATGWQRPAPPRRPSLQDARSPVRFVCSDPPPPPCCAPQPHERALLPTARPLRRGPFLPCSPPCSGRQRPVKSRGRWRLRTRPLRSRRRTEKAMVWEWPWSVSAESAYLTWTRAHAFDAGQGLASGPSSCVRFGVGRPKPQAIGGLRCAKRGRAGRAPFVPDARPKQPC